MGADTAKEHGTNKWMFPAIGAVLLLIAGGFVMWSLVITPPEITDAPESEATANEPETASTRLFVVGTVTETSPNRLTVSAVEESGERMFSFSFSPDTEFSSLVFADADDLEGSYVAIAAGDISLGDQVTVYIDGGWHENAVMTADRVVRIE